jgi:hypothetical protein
VPRHLASSFDSVPPRRLDPLAVLGSLSARDRSIVSLLDEHGVLTTGQLARVFFTRVDVAQRRLLRLTRLLVLDRFRWRLPVGSEPWHYVLGPVGAVIAAARRGVDPPPPATVKKRAVLLASLPQLDHLVALNGWFCDLAAEARTTPGARLAVWWSERRCAERFGTIVRPDGAGTYVCGERRVEFFVEYDAGTETLGRVAAKLLRYGELAAAGGPAVPVLVWCESATRERHLRDLVVRQRTAGLPPSAPVALGSTATAAALGVGLTGTCWLVPGEQERRRLLDLASLGRRPRRAASGDATDVVPPWEEG